MLMLRSSNKLAQENGTPLLVWLLIILALALFVAFIIWWYRRSRAGQEPVGLHRPEEPEIELPAEPEPLPAMLAEIGLPPAEPEPLPVRTAEIETPAMPEIPPVDVPAATPPEVAMPTPQDDLVLIEGIGPKIASVLQAAGITTFKQLAETDVSRLHEILVAANLRFIDPATWPEQAHLAAAGDWAGFDALTRELRGGRRA